MRGIFHSLRATQGHQSEHPFCPSVQKQEKKELRCLRPHRCGAKYRKIERRKYKMYKLTRAHTILLRPVPKPKPGTNASKSSRRGKRRGTVTVAAQLKENKSQEPFIHSRLCVRLSPFLPYSPKKQGFQERVEKNKL